MKIEPIPPELVELIDGCHCDMDATRGNYDDALDRFRCERESYQALVRLGEQLDEVKAYEEEVKVAQDFILCMTELNYLSRDELVLEMLRLGYSDQPIDWLQRIVVQALKLLNERSAILCSRLRCPDGREVEMWHAGAQCHD